eukprot:358741-Chlamydomonas_euryale.AAC.1
MIDENIEERRCDYAPLSHSRLDSERVPYFTINSHDRLRARVQIFSQFDHVRVHSIQLEYLPQRFPTNAIIRFGKVHKCNRNTHTYTQHNTQTKPNTHPPAGYARRVKTTSVAIQAQSMEAGKVWRQTKPNTHPPAGYARRVKT